MGKVSDEHILSALVTAPTIREAATICGCSESTIYARLRDDDFKKKYNAERRKLLERNATALQNQIETAVQTMAEVMKNKEVAPQVRLNAADAVIRNGLKLTELVDVTKRVDELESIVSELEGKRK